MLGILKKSNVYRYTLYIRVGSLKNVKKKQKTHILTPYCPQETQDFVSVLVFSPTHVCPCLDWMCVCVCVCVYVRL